MLEIVQFNKSLVRKVLIFQLVNLDHFLVKNDYLKS